MNLGDPDLELIDPTPNIHALFLQFDKLFFCTKLASRAVVRWSKRMYSCAGICSYEGRGGLCDIALSEPLLKLRTRKNIVETLLHEMIHAYLFITNKDRDRDGHGPNFQAHMHRINKSAGLHISIYHDFHDEVKLYQTHVWRCNGPCQNWKPFFGIVRRSMNRAPGPNDFWFDLHKGKCGGSFIKIKEPEKVARKGGAGKKTSAKKENITKFVTSVKNNLPIIVQKPVLKNSNITTISELNNSLKPYNSNMTGVNNRHINKIQTNKFISTEVGVITKEEPCSSFVKKPTPILYREDDNSNSRKRANSLTVVETVRNVWANKQLSRSENKASSGSLSNNFRKQRSLQTFSPPNKIQKIDDYFKKTASSVLKDIYGEDFQLTQANNNKLIATINKEDLVDCPVCNKKINNNDVNKHLDECLNQEVIKSISNDSENNTAQKSTKPKAVLNDGNSISNLDTFTSKTTNTLSNKATLNVEDSANVASKLTQSNSRKSVRDSISFNFSKALLFDNNVIVKSTDNITCFIDDNLVKFSSQNIINNTSQSENNKTNKTEDNNKMNHNNVNYREKVEVLDKNLKELNKYIVCDKNEDENIDGKNQCLEDADKIVINSETEVSKDFISPTIEQKCLCCGNKIDKSIEEHLDECMSFFTDNSTMPVEGASTSFADDVIHIDDDDDSDGVLDETLTMNATGTKFPCPCCFTMIEHNEMNNHLDQCLKTN